MEIRSRWSFHKKIKKMDADLNFQDIASMTMLDFVSDAHLCIILGVLKGLTVPHISKLLKVSGGISDNPQKRMDDTVIAINKIFYWGCKSKIGYSYIKRINELHWKYNIPQRDYNYLMAIDVTWLLYWVKRYGWRQMTDDERKSWLYQWQQTGGFMGLQGMPTTLAEVENYIAEYDGLYAEFHPVNKEMADLILCNLVKKSNVFLRPFVSPGVRVLLGASVCEKLGWKYPGPIWQKTIFVGLKVRAIVLSFCPIIIKKEKKYISYPDGHDVADIGAKCPFSKKSEGV